MFYIKIASLIRENLTRNVIRKHSIVMKILTNIACWIVIFTATQFGLYSQDLSILVNQSYIIKSNILNHILPWWYKNTIDTNHGGFILEPPKNIEGNKRIEKQIVTQARMVWGFSHAHRKGFSSTKYNYLDVAKKGYEFINNHFYDNKFGGYYWTVDSKGKPLDTRKIIYGQAFVIYAFVEFSRATGDTEPLSRALQLYQTLQKRAYDSKNGGWYEHFTYDWQLITNKSPNGDVEVPGLKSANTHLHIMEALAELYDATKNQDVKNSLIEALNINKTWFYPSTPGKSCFHKQPNWSDVTDPASSGLSYGHNIEFAWLMIRAETVLGQKPSWNHFYAIIDHSLKYGFDNQFGGFYNRGYDDKPATDTTKIWWVQAEGIAALTDAIIHKPEQNYISALNKTLNWISKYQEDNSDHVWFDTVSADGSKQTNNSKSHNWKANYHDLRALVKFIDALNK